MFDTRGFQTTTLNLRRALSQYGLIMTPEHRHAALDWGNYEYPIPSGNGTQLLLETNELFLYG